MNPSVHSVKTPFLKPAARIIMLICLIGFISPLVLAGEKSPVNKSWRNIAIEGYDAVAYFTKGTPTQGHKDYSFSYNGADWLFESAANRDAFMANPEQYAPQYGGYCAWAVANNSLATIDPKAWKIVDGKLYLNYSTKIQQKWEKDIPGHIVAANENWPKVLK